jgi:EAL domain-containing protein (putative c-di-GMP-specific phosphodiesterase class I)
MYRAKERGRACFEVFDEGMHAQVVERLKLETDFRRALDRGELRVHYQPIASLADDATSFEALVRWQHPSRGLLAPAEFLPIAEETGLILQLDLWVLREACRQARRWQADLGIDPAPLVGVNLSPRHFTRGDIVAQVGEILAATELDPRRLALEITESVLLEDMDRVREALQQLKALKVNLYLDDFGTGYSSLSYLHRLPIDSLKIDSSFVRQLGEPSDRGEIVEAITAMAKNLRMGVIAEGVETPEQMRLLRRLQCERVQGFLISRPLPPEEAGAFLARRRAVLQP